ncbi:MAG TPA: hypothetical protein VNN62_18045, partial [Methylomirabilota bacterium]|nr:hypothetical protein [Methylomirabilota bacterium]
MKSHYRFLTAAAGLALWLLTMGQAAAWAEQQQTQARPAPPSMSKEEVTKFLARPIIARLATVRPNGTPQ